MLKEELITQGVLIDPRDEYLLDLYAWYFDGDYVVASIYPNGECKRISLAREVLHAAPHELVDHRNQNPKDCRRENLRLTTRRVNRLNTYKTSGVRVTTSGKYQARVGQVNLGSFSTYEEAKRVRDSYVEKEIA